MLGGAWRLKQALRESEDSVKLNSSFVERLNLTIRQGSPLSGSPNDLSSPWKEQLEDRLELFRCYDNFIRPHRALKFGCEVRTPAMQAGLTRRQLVLREIFEAGIACLASNNVLFADSAPSVHAAARRMPVAA